MNHGSDGNEPRQRWVKNAVLPVGAALLVCPRTQTIERLFQTSHLGHNRTRALPQTFTLSTCQRERAVLATL